MALLHELARTQRQQPAWMTLQQSAQQLAKQCTAANQALFAQLRDDLRQGRCSPRELRAQLDRFTAYQPDNGSFLHWGEEVVDELLRGIVTVTPIPQPSFQLEREMVHLEHTPTSVVLEMVDRAGITPQSHFFDIGSGLGQVAILVHLLTGARASGVELDGAFCACARQSAAALGLQGVDFVNLDARHADYQSGDIFFLFTPFRGAILQSVLDRLRAVATQNAITLCTYGPCTLTVAQQPWLKSIDTHADHEFKLAIFQRHSS